MRNMTRGNPLKLMITFAIPIMLGNIFQLFYSLADTRIVGSVLGAEALAAVGGTTVISSLIIGFLQGLTNGFAIITAQYFGAEDKEKLRKTFAGTLLLGGVTTLALSFIALTGLDVFFDILNIPENLYTEASEYISLILFGAMITMLYNGLAGVLRAVGDTKAPLLFLVLAAFLNVGLDILFMAVLPLGVGGAALGTVLAQGVSVVLCFGYMWKKYPVFHLKKEDFCLEKQMIKQMYTSGLSMGMMLSLVVFGTLALQSTINTFGTEIIVAHTAARKVSEIFFLPISVMGMATSTFCSQNYGAGNIERVKKGIKNGFLVCCLWAVIIIIISYTLAPQLVYLVTGSKIDTVIETAVRYLRINSLFFFFMAGIGIFRNSLQALGEYATPLITSGIELVSKVVIAMILVPMIGYMGVILAEPIIWIIMVIPLTIQILTTPKLKASQNIEKE